MECEWYHINKLVSRSWSDFMELINPLSACQFWLESKYQVAAIFHNLLPLLDAPIFGFQVTINKMEENQQFIFWSKQQYKVNVFKRTWSYFSGPYEASTIWAFWSLEWLMLIVYSLVMMICCVSSYIIQVIATDLFSRVTIIYMYQLRPIVPYFV